MAVMISSSNMRNGDGEGAGGKLGKVWGLRVQVLLVTLLWAVVGVAGEPTERYPHRLVLDEPDRYVLYWKVNGANITFETHVRTTGYIGFGLSPDGRMANSDIVIGGVNDTSTEPYFQDRFASGHFLPAVDTSQDWQLLSSQQSSEVTVLKFTRYITSCDPMDRNITRSTMRLIWAYSDTDELRYHTRARRGSQQVDLLRYQDDFQEPPEDAFSLNYAMDNVDISEYESVYFCKGFKVHSSLTRRKHHLIKFVSDIQAGNEKFIQHMVMTACHYPINDTFHRSLHRCGMSDASNNPFALCLSPVAFWATGAVRNYSFPENVGLPFGDGYITFLSLEIHYFNPMRRTVFDNSGFHLWFTPTLRENEAGIHLTGSEFSRNHIIPPYQDSFITVGWCPQTCLDQSIVDRTQGMNIFGIVLHANQLGIKIRLRHFRNGEELPNIAQNDAYSSSINSVQDSAKPVKVLATDTMALQCVYNSSDQTNLTLGGYSTQEEQCIAFVMFYPRNNLSACFTVPTADSLLASVPGIKFMSNESSVTITEPEGYAGLDLWGVLGRQNWTDKSTSDRFQRATLLGNMSYFCQIGEGYSYGIIPVPQITKTFTERSRCWVDPSPPKDSGVSGTSDRLVLVLSLILLSLMGL